MPDGLLADLAADRSFLARTSTAERIVEVLRGRITEGYFTPGTRLSEDALAEALGVSRNTLREAFRLLTHERLLEYRLNRGVFVRSLTVEDIVELYRVRTVIESAALAVAGVPRDLATIRAATEDGEQAASRADWQAAGTADIRLHQAIVALAGSTRLNDYVGGLFAELRLAFLVCGDPEDLHRPYVQRNRRLLTLLEQDDLAGAQRELTDYLQTALEHLVAAMDPARRQPVPAS